MRSIISSFAAAAFATVILTAPALADNGGALSVGKPAGVQHAQLSGDIVWVGLAAAIAAACAFAAASGLNHPATAVVTTTTTTTATSTTRTTSTTP